MTPAPPIILTIAGYDPSSGAGVTADVKTAAAHGCFAVSCITALTIQSTSGVRRVEPVRGELVADTLAELAADLHFSGIRIGMLGSGEVARAVVHFLETNRPRNVVLDPVLKSSSGAELLDSAGFAIVRDRLLRLADVITPNTDEVAALAGVVVTTPSGMRSAAARLHQMGARAVVITGGDLPQPTDLLSIAAGNQVEYPGERLDSSSTHGTGCAFATALTCRLALGSSLPDAVRDSKNYVTEAIAHAYPLGRGRGPIAHLYRFNNS